MRDNFAWYLGLAPAFENTKCCLSCFGAGLGSTEGIGHVGLVVHSPGGTCFAGLGYLVVVVLGEGLLVLEGISCRTSV